MNDFNRKLYGREWGESEYAEAPVHGNTQIYKGDLLFLDRIDGLRDKGTSSADYYIYPFSLVSGSTRTLESNKLLAGQNFIGVATWHSDSGVTENIGIHIDGLFRYPLKNSRTLRTSYKVVPAGSGVTCYNQRVATESGSSSLIGVVANSGKFQSEVEMSILTLFASETRYQI